MSNRRQFLLTVWTAKEELITSAADTDGADEYRKDMARLFSAMQIFSFTASARLGVGESAICDRMKHIYTKLKNLRHCFPLIQQYGGKNMRP